MESSGISIDPAFYQSKKSDSSIGTPEGYGEVLSFFFSVSSDSRIHKNIVYEPGPTFSF